MAPTSPVRATAWRARNRASTSFRKCTCSRSGASAEFGNVQGAVINVITRQGSNRFLYDASYYGQPAGLTSQPVQLPYPARPSRKRIRTRQVSRPDDQPRRAGRPRSRSGSLRGYQYLRDYDSQPGTDPALPRTYEQDKVFAKLTWRLAPRLQLVQSYHEEFWVNPELPTLCQAVRSHPAAPCFGARGDVRRPHAHLSPNTVWDVRAGPVCLHARRRPEHRRSDDPRPVRQPTGLPSGAPAAFGDSDLARTTVKATLDSLPAGSAWRRSPMEDREPIRRGRASTLRRSFQPASGTSTRTARRPRRCRAIHRLPAASSITASAFVSDAITRRAFD